MSAAHFFKERTGKVPKILILDNHDDFGGHAKRNEFVVNDRTMLAYGGSQSVESPSYYEEVSKKLLSDLGIDFEKFYTAYDFDYFKNRKLDTGFYLTKQPMESVGSLKMYLVSDTILLIKLSLIHI